MRSNRRRDAPLARRTDASEGEQRTQLTQCEPDHILFYADAEKSFGDWHTLRLFGRSDRGLDCLSALTQINRCRAILPLRDDRGLAGGDAVEIAHRPRLRPEQCEVDHVQPA